MTQLKQSQKALNAQDSQKLTQNDLFDRSDNPLIWSSPLHTQVFINLYNDRAPDANVSAKDSVRAKQHFQKEREALLNQVKNMRDDNTQIG
jgi:hypothetical protein